MVSLIYIKELINKSLKKLTIEEQPKDFHDKLLWTHSYNTLTLLSELLEKKLENPALSLQTFLHEHWKQINGTCLSYTTINESELFNILCEVAEYTAETLNSTDLKDTPVGSINLLMPTVNTESIDEEHYANLGSYTDLEDLVKVNNSLNIKTVLKTHILGEGGRYLIPVSLLPDLLENKENNRYNPYYNFRVHKDLDVFINENEKKRLIEHSNSTKALNETWMQYQTISNDKSHLLGRLHILCQSLYLNSKEGLGNELNAGIGAYTAIINFKEYYENLEEKRQEQIPEQLKKEIDLLLDLSSKPEVNVNATENMITCIAERRRSLLELIEGNEETLAQIALDNNKQSILIKSSKENYEETKKQFLTSLKNDNYVEGHDHLKLSSQLLKNAKIDISISSINDLELFSSLSPEEIRHLGENTKGLAKQIANQFINIEELSVFILSTKPAVVEAILSISSEELTNKLLLESENLSALLSIQDKERSSIILNSLKNYLPKIIASSHVISAFLENLSKEHRLIVFDAIKEHLPINSARDFKQILKNLSDEQRIIVFNAEKENFLDLINTAQEFYDVGLYLNPEYRETLFDSVKERISIKSSEDITKIMSIILPEQLFLDKKHEDTLIKNVQTPKDFMFISQHALDQYGPIIYSLAKEAIFRNINDIKGFNHVAQTLSRYSISSEELCIDKKDFLSKFITNGSELAQVMRWLDPSSCCVVTKILKDSMSRIVKDENELSNLYSQIGPEKTKKISEIMITSTINARQRFFTSNSKTLDDKDEKTLNQTVNKKN